ncbi:hypothetical protein JXA70_10395 [candidate division KSB1 bacterium]|nr:hypothetical protein [candidate division KSB1 bacterium]
MKKAAVVALALALLLACGGKRPELPKTEYHQKVSAHTSGVVSRLSVLRIVFVDNLIQPDKIGTAIDPSPFSFKPKINGVAVWASERMIEFRPTEPLLQDQEYEANLDLRDVMVVEKEEATFSFTFKTVKQTIDIRLDGLTAVDKTDLSVQRLAGVLELADEENLIDVKKIVAAEQGGNPLEIEWLTRESGREFQFSIQGITRQENTSQIILTWDGSPIDVDDKGKTTFDIPGLNTFAVVSARAVRAEREYIELHFSDPLKRQQNLEGLISVTNHPTLRFTISQNSVAIYSAARFIGDIQITVSAGIRNSMDYQITQDRVFTVHFEELKPQVRFVGDGGIIPTTQGLTVPFEVVNLRAVMVSAVLINDQKIPQFLQVNNLRGEQELERVGQVVWRDVVELDVPPNKINQWVRFGLDVSPLVQQNPSGIFRITLSFRKQHAIFECPDHDEIENNLDVTTDPWENDEPDQYRRYYRGSNYREYYSNRQNPCHPAYYMDWYDHQISAAKNFLISDLGLIAKRSQNDSLFVIVTDIKSTKPQANVSLKVLDYQQNLVGQGTTNSDGVAIIKTQRPPFLLLAQSGRHSGYLKLNDGNALSMSHFDVSGANIEKGLCGYIYGERGVWRPGDPIYLTFILLDDGTLPAHHPVRFELKNPRDQIVERITRTSSINGFYTFATQTTPDAPTGDWLATIQVGGLTFSKSLKVETIMPNRLKIQLDMGEKKQLTAGQLQGVLSASWLHGAVARALKAEIELKFQPIRTTFPSLQNYIFDDPAKIYEPESQTIFQGALNDSGNVTFRKNIVEQDNAPGLLQAQFKTRVFEPGGAFSTDYFSMPYHPFQHYVGFDLSDSDGRGGIYIDSTYTIHFARVNPGGEMTGNGAIEIKLYRIQWRWWWEKGEDYIADYISRRSYQPSLIDTLQLINGAAQWNLRLSRYGRYFLHVRDLNGKHSSGAIFYGSWRHWWQHAGDATPGGVNVLTFAADKEEVQVGETVNITIPTAYQGRGLISIESGTRILQTEWFEANEDQYHYSFKATANMAPNIYVYVSFLQPHLQAGNDLPLRLYGVLPISVFNPASKLAPEILCDYVFRPENEVQIKVREQNNSPMTYTLAIVDEGLLDLTRFRTPNPWDHFYQRQALGIKTFDLYDLVAGAYGGDLEKLLAIGGGDEVEIEGQRKANRFPPMVRFYGPFELAKNKTNSHVVDIPQYIGSVRVMVVAGHKTAFGAAEKAVAVRKPLMVLGTLPRVLGVQESVSMPTSVFALEDNIRKVDVSVTVDGPLTFDGPEEKSLKFSETGDQLVHFDLLCSSLPGIATIHIEAKSGDETAHQEIEIDVRNPMRNVVDVVGITLAADKAWRQDIKFPGLRGTNSVMLEISRIPPLNLSKRLDFLIHYPYGCIEQTTSSVFPQLYLDDLVSLPSDRQRQIQENIKAGIDRLRTFQTSDGGFAYWPGDSDADDWSTNYAGHFMVEAKQAGYNLPSGMLEQWRTFQKRRAAGWVTGPYKAELMQAYRLYTLALSGEADLGAMNRLKERANLPTTAKWKLAAAYKLAGQDEAARALAKGDVDLRAYRELSNTYGSDLRDKAMILETLTLLGDMNKAQQVVADLSASLNSEKWLSTQTTAYMLIAIARYAGLSDAGASVFDFQFTWGKNSEQNITSDAPIFQRELSAGMDSTGSIKLVNESASVLYPRLIMSGLPKLGSETSASNGLSCHVAYHDKAGKSVDISQLSQGMDVIAEVTVKNIGNTGRYDEIAVAHLVPSGWEIHNERLTDGAKVGDIEYQDIRDDRVYTFFDLNQGEEKTIRLLLTASYIGTYYLPPIYIEAMYDATINARVKGTWTKVVLPGKE